ncbi:MAG: carotenoid oxygenase family protein, partial [Chroococcidiopsis sp.]
MDIANFINHYLEGNFAPVKEEKTAVDLPTAGKIPDELNGLFLRNGPNAIGKPEPSTYHNFAGEGMVHGVCLRNGKALWYRNRWVRGDTVRAVLDESDIGGPVHAHDFAAN